MKKNYLISSLIGLCGLASVANADMYTLNVNVQATIPASDGLIVSDVGGWSSSTQVMRWNMATTSLDPVRQQLDLKSGIGEIKAYLTDNAMLTSAANTIPLTVSIKGKTLQVGTSNAVSILSQQEAATGQRVDFTIETTGAGPFDEGNYGGLVLLMFESNV